MYEWLKEAWMRSTDEDGSGRNAREHGNVRSIVAAVGVGGATRSVVQVGSGGVGSRCFVSVSKRSAASPGAASARYHDRAGSEILRDDDIAEWRGDRYSVVISPEDPTVDLAVLADKVIEALTERHGGLTTSAWRHHDGGVDHLHVAVSAEGGRVIVTQRGVERAVQGAVKALERTRERGMSR